MSRRLKDASADGSKLRFDPNTDDPAGWRGTDLSALLNKREDARLLDRLWPRILVSVFAFSLPCALRSQNPPSPKPQVEGAISTLKATTHLTIEDVIVTDASGKPVLGLPQSAFHVTDNGAPQSLRSFEEMRGTKQMKTAKLAHGVFSNAGQNDPDASVEVLLLDPIAIEIADQMFLRLQALRYLNSMPAGTTVTVFRTSRDGRPLLVQSATQDRELLIKAVNISIPTFAVSVPQEEVLFNAIGELSNIADYLAQAQGRKSLIWFAGKFPLSQVLGGNGAQQSENFSAIEEALKGVYRKLEASRVAVFPIDVRGLADQSLAVSLQAATQPDQGGGPNQIAGGAAEAQGSWGAMDELAAATGGRAFHGNNRLTEQVRLAVDLGRHYYTLSYSAKPYEENGVWHKVNIAVDGRYSASFRQGYFARPSAAAERRASAALHKAETSSDVAGPAPTAPIVFTAKVLPGPGKSKERFVIRYAISTRDLQFKAVEGTQQARLKVAALGYNTSGMIVSSAVDEVSTRYSLAQMGEAEKIGVPIEQEMKFAKGAKFLLLSVVDLDTGRTGTVQLTMDSANQAIK